MKRFVFSYDKSGNRTGEQIDDVPTTASFNELNQMTANQSAGPLRFKGSLSETGTVTVAGISSTMATGTNFIGSASSTVGTNVVAVIARDYSNNARTNNYQVVVSNLVNRTLTYDDNGNMASDGTRTYEWDAANRLTKISQSTNYVAFTYDGMGRRVGMIDVSGSTTNSNKKFLWCDTEMCEQRDSSGGTTTKQFFEYGVRDNSTNYFYTRDHLGSVREVVDNSQAIAARYDYDPYGRRTKVSGSYDADFGYTGHFHEQPGWMTTGVVFTKYRIYDPELGRWTSKDPIGERGGMNLYGYVGNDPINSWDPLGLKICWKFVKITYFGDYEPDNPGPGNWDDKRGAFGDKLTYNDLAVGHWGKNQHPSPAKPKDRNWVLKHGTKVTVHPFNSASFEGTVKDVGGHDKHRTQKGKIDPEMGHELGPDDWIDVWNPEKSKQEGGDYGYVQTEVSDDCPCPEGYNEL